MSDRLRYDVEQYRRWVMGDAGRFDCGLQWRVVRGKKRAGDLRMEWNVAGRWVPVGMDASFVLADFHYEIEDVLYPPPQHLGGEKFHRALRASIEHGWRRAASELDAERARSGGAAIARGLDYFTGHPYGCASCGVVCWSTNGVEAICRRCHTEGRG